MMDLNITNRVKDIISRFLHCYSKILNKLYIDFILYISNKRVHKKGIMNSKDSAHDYKKNTQKSKGSSHNSLGMIDIKKFMVADLNNILVSKYYMLAVQCMFDSYLDTVNSYFHSHNIHYCSFNKLKLSNFNYSNKKYMNLHKDSSFLMYY